MGHFIHFYLHFQEMLDGMQTNYIMTIITKNVIIDKFSLLGILASWESAFAFLLTMTSIWKNFFWLSWLWQLGHQVWILSTCLWSSQGWCRNFCLTVESGYSVSTLVLHVKCCWGHWDSGLLYEVPYPRFGRPWMNDQCYSIISHILFEGLSSNYRILTITRRARILFL